MLGDRNALRPIGFTVNSVNNGGQALTLLAKKEYAVAFVDAKIPDMDGLSLAALIRQRNPLTNIILISGFITRKIRRSLKVLKTIYSLALLLNRLIK